MKAIIFACWLAFIAPAVLSQTIDKSLLEAQDGAEAATLLALQEIGLQSGEALIELPAGEVGANAEGDVEGIYHTDALSIESQDGDEFLLPASQGLFVELSADLDDRPLETKRCDSLCKMESHEGQVFYLSNDGRVFKEVNTEANKEFGQFHAVGVAVAQAKKVHLAEDGSMATETAIVQAKSVCKIGKVCAVGGLPSDAEKRFVLLENSFPREAASKPLIPVRFVEIGTGFARGPVRQSVGRVVTATKNAFSNAGRTIANALARVVRWPQQQQRPQQQPQTQQRKTVAQTLKNFRDNSVAAVKNVAKKVNHIFRRVSESRAGRATAQGARAVKAAAQKAAQKVKKTAQKAAQKVKNGAKKAAAKVKKASQKGAQKAKKLAQKAAKKGKKALQKAAKKAKEAAKKAKKAAKKVVDNPIIQHLLNRAKEKARLAKEKAKKAAKVTKKGLQNFANKVRAEAAKKIKNLNKRVSKSLKCLRKSLLSLRKNEIAMKKKVQAYLSKIGNNQKALSTAVQRVQSVAQKALEKTTTNAKTVSAQAEGTRKYRKSVSKKLDKVAIAAKLAALTALREFLDAHRAAITFGASGTNKRLGELKARVANLKKAGLKGKTMKKLVKTVKKLSKQQKQRENAKRALATGKKLRRRSVKTVKGLGKRGRGKRGRGKRGRGKRGNGKGKKKGDTYHKNVEYTGPGNDAESKDIRTVRLLKKLAGRINHVNYAYNDEDLKKGVRLVAKSVEKIQNARTGYQRACRGPVCVRGLPKDK